MKQKSSFSIKDVVAIGVGAALFVVIAMIANSGTCTEYEYSVAICPSGPLQCSFWTNCWFLNRLNWSCH